MVLPARHARRAGPAAALAAVYALAVTVGPTANVEVNDLFLYRSMTSLVAGGLIPYHDWEFEYPPLAIVPIALGGMFGNDEATYPIVFGVLMLGCLLALQACVGALAGRAAAWACVPAPLLLGAMIRTHYDLLPAAIVAGALLLVARGRTTWAFAALGAGAVTKLVPALLVPILVAWLLGRGERERVLPGLAAFAAVVALVSAPVPLRRVRRAVPLPPRAARADRVDARGGALGDRRLVRHRHARAARIASSPTASTAGPPRRSPRSSASCSRPPTSRSSCSRGAAATCAG